MKALWGVFAVVLVSFPNPLVALTVDCVPDRGCQKGEKVGEECCERPPCEFFYRLMNYKWMVRAHLSDKVMDAIVKDLDHTLLLSDEYFKQRHDFDECPEHRLAMDDPPTFRADYTRDCEMLVHSNPAADGQPLSSLQQVLDKTLTCQEWVADELDFGHEQVRECLAQDRSHHWSHSLRPYEFQLWKMEAHLTDYCKLCTCSPEAELARWIVKHANPPLKDPPNKKRPPKKTPKRAVQKSR